MRIVLKRLAACFLASVALGGVSLSASQKKPNVLFIAVDDLRCSVGAYGDPVSRTPNLDRLASMGTAFTRAYVQQAVCSASRASLLTGCRPDTTTVDYPYNDYFLEEFLPAHPSLPRFFASNGYRVRCAGKLHHDETTGEYDGLEFDKPWRGKGSWRGYALPENIAPPLGQKPPAYERAEVADVAYQDGRIAESVSDALRRYAAGSRETPFFFAAGFRKPHLPFTAPSKYWDLYDPEEFVLPENLPLPEDLKSLANASYELPAYRDGQIDFDDRARLRHLTHAYYACVSFTDANVGKLVDALEATGLIDSTVIVLWSDHGFHLGENQSFGKHTCFEQATRAPLMVVDPRLGKSHRCDRLVEFVDLFPTLCELTGVPAPDYLEGESLVPFLSDPTHPGKEAVYSQWPRSKAVEGFSVRTDRYRYTEWRDKSKPGAGELYTVVASELYDHQTDPMETVNLAASEPQQVASLSQLLK